MKSPLSSGTDRHSFSSSRIAASPCVRRPSSRVFTQKKLVPYNFVFLVWILIDQFPLGLLIPPPPPLAPTEVTAALTRQCIGYSPVALTPCASILFFFPFLFLLGGKASDSKSDYPPRKKAIFSTPPFLGTALESARRRLAGKTAAR